MRQIKIVCLIIGLCWSSLGWAQGLDENTTYVLVLPEWNLYFADFDASLRSHPVKISFIDDTAFLLSPLDTHDAWRKSFTEDRISGWFGRISSTGAIHISGVMSEGEWDALVELSGEYVAEHIIQGKAVFRPGTRSAGPSPLEYRGEWALYQEQYVKEIEVSSRLTYHGPTPEPQPTPVPNEAKAQYPPTSDLRVQRFAKEEPFERERFYKGLPHDDKIYFDKLLVELTWENIPYTPGILLLIDHLAGVTEEYRQLIAEGYVRDGSLHFFDPMPYEELQQIPPLFATLYVLDNMPEEDVQGLQEGSPRFAAMLEAYRGIPAEALADLTMPELIINISERLPEEFRRDSYTQSPKLRAYISTSEDERLQDLYPF